MRSEKKDMTGCRIGRLFVLKDSGKHILKCYAEVIKEKEDERLMQKL